MPTRLLKTLASHARWTVIVVVALLAGGAGGMWATTAGSAPTVTIREVADGRTAGDRATGKPEKAAKPEKAGKPITPHKADDLEDAEAGRPEHAGVQGAHGACVSAVARSAAIGGKNANHGGAVSAAARSEECRSAQAHGKAGTAPGKSGAAHDKSGAAQDKVKPTRPDDPSPR